MFSICRLDVSNPVTCSGLSGFTYYSVSGLIALMCLLYVGVFVWCSVQTQAKETSDQLVYF